MQLVVGLLAEVAALRERVDEHERLLRRDSTNSSLPAATQWLWVAASSLMACYRIDEVVP